MIYTNDLLIKYRENKNVINPQILVFTGVPSKDVYNITAPFHIDNREVIAGRVESRDSEKSEIKLFEKKTDTEWSLIEESITLELQDPFYTIIDGKIILGGVEVEFISRDRVEWKTVFYELSSISDAKRLFEGPVGMKDLRLKQLENGQILVLTRPQGNKGGRGKIGYTIINSFEELSITQIESAPLLKKQFNDDEWGGANEIYELDGKVFVLGHIANFDSTGDRHYYAMAFELDMVSGTLVNPKIICERSDFLEGPSKRPDLVDVVFSGGLLLLDKKAVLFAGISDAGAQRIELVNPFINKN